MNDLVGREIARRYRVETFLGKGGMAEVYKVWDQERSVHLAMKILHADLAEDKVFLRRFKREAQTLAKLQHPNIVRFYGLEQDEDLVYMLMDYVEGTTLRKEIFQAKAPLSVERIVEVMKPICAALYYAHKSGFVHCDMKPANIMIHKNGTVYVADFGIARMTEASTSTMIGAGTPAYMSPEQARGEDPIPQTDIYALGVVLFEMLTGGERPFTGESAKTTGSTSEKVRWEQMKLAAPPPSKYNPGVSAEMDEIVLKCLEKQPANRYLSATDLFGELTMQVNTPVISTPVLPPPPEPEFHGEKQEIPAGTLVNTNDQQPVVQSGGLGTKRSNKKLRVAGVIVLSTLAIIAGLFFIGASRSGNGFFFLNSTLTATPRPTSTSRPTETRLPPTPTPASLGEVVRDGSIEISVLDVYRHDKLIPGNGFRYTANPGYMIIDLVVKVQNTGASTAFVKWDDAYVIVDTGSRLDLLFAGLRLASKKEKIDPLSIDYNVVDINASIEITDTAYLRIIYVIPDKPEQIVFFGFEDSPLISFTVKK